MVGHVGRDCVNPIKINATELKQNPTFISQIQLHAKPFTNIGRNLFLSGPHQQRIGRADGLQILTVSVSFQDHHWGLTVHVLLHSHRAPRIHFAVSEEDIGHVWSESIVIAVRLGNFLKDTRFRESVKKDQYY